MYRVYGRTLVVAGALLAIVLISACQPIQPMAESAATAESAAPVEAASGEAATTAEAPTLMVASNDTLGEFLVDGSGMTLYQFDKDTQGAAGAPAVSNCYDKCADAWPPLHVEAGATATAGEGLDANLVGSVERTDGTMIVTYNGWPLYYWWEDAAAGDTLGQAVGDVWWVITPAGEPVRGMIKVGKSEALGEFVTDMAGMTLYQFDNDTQGTADTAAVSNCVDQCAEAWPPLLLGEGAHLLPGAHIDGALLGTTTRADGAQQVTYNGWPLYYWYEDVAAGDTLGQAVRDVWWVVNPAGEPVH